MNFKLLALDLDGTLTNSQKQISAKNKETIQKAIDMGVSIVLASGRPVIGIKRVAEELDLYRRGGYILAYNGGHIIECKSEKTIIKKTVPMEYYRDICACGAKFGVFVLTYNEYGVIAESDTDKYVIKEAYNNSIPIIRVPCLEKSVKEPVVKFMIVGEPDRLKEVHCFMEKLFKGKLNVFFSEPYFLEVTPPGIEKSSSLAELIRYMGIDKKELIACGDGLNDISMLKYAGFAVAMENAYEETKKYSDYIAASNEENGVAEAIEKFILM